MNVHLLAAVSVALLLSGCSSSSKAPTGKAPSAFRVKFETSKGDFFIDVNREWSPLGADRFYELVNSGFFDGARFFRVVPGFVVQFGLKGDPATDAKWEASIIEDDPPGTSNTPGTVSFATRGPRSRTSQLFINLGNNARLDAMGFTPFGRVSEGMPVVANITSQYGEGPDQTRIRAEGNAYLQREFPELDFIKKATVLTAP